MRSRAYKGIVADPSKYSANLNLRVSPARRQQSGSPTVSFKAKAVNRSLTVKLDPPYQNVYMNTYDLNSDIANVQNAEQYSRRRMRKTNPATATLSSNNSTVNQVTTFGISPTLVSPEATAKRLTIDGQVNVVYKLEENQRARPRVAVRPFVTPMQQRDPENAPTKNIQYRSFDRRNDAKSNSHRPARELQPVSTQ